MIHSRFDFDQALESAQKASKRTKKPRYLVQTARGWDIEKQEPQTNLYGYFRIEPSGQIAICDALIEGSL